MCRYDSFIGDTGFYKTNISGFYKINYLNDF